MRISNTMCEEGQARDKQGLTTRDKPTKAIDAGSKGRVQHVLHLAQTGQYVVDRNERAKGCYIGEASRHSRTGECSQEALQPNTAGFCESVGIGAGTRDCVS